jgi:cysteine desulfurase
MEEAEAVAWANPSSVHGLGRHARRFLEDTREQLARLLAKSPRDVVFTGGGTEANHLALNGVRFLVTSRIEHPSIVAQAETMASAGVHVEFAQVGSDGRITPEAVEESLARLQRLEGFPSKTERDGGISAENTPIVAVMAANHETGVLQPIPEIADVAHERGARLHVDAVQLLGKGALSVLDAADSISVSAHKLRGPKGLGALAFECGFVPRKLGHGGAQERGLRPGTVDAVALAGFGAALHRLDASQANYIKVASLRDRLEASFRDRSANAITVHGSESLRLGHVTNFSAAGWKGDELVAALDLHGVCVSSGSACSAGSPEPSAVLLAMLGAEAAEGAVRVSFGEESTEADLDALLRALTQLGVLSSSSDLA